MLEKYRKNLILFDGAVYYCLLCDELLGSIQYLEKHIRCDTHINRLEQQAYFHGFRKEFIHKIEKYFYCETCNTVVSDMDAVAKHIEGDGHKAMKIKPKTQKKNIFHYESGYVTKNKITLDMVKWNTIIDKKCMVCNVEVQDKSSHIRLKEHVIKLCSTEVLSVFDERYYREININKYHCFTCNRVFSAPALHEHWQTCKNNDENEINNQKEGESSRPKAIHTKRIRRLQEFFLVDPITKSSTCKHCKTVVTINFPAMFKHLNIHYDNVGLEKEPDCDPDTRASLEEKVKKYFEITDHGKRRSELAKYGKENSIKLNYNGRRGWCLLCDRFLVAHKNSFEQHIIGATHQGNLELQGLISPKVHDARPVKTKSIKKCRLEFLFESDMFYVFDYLRIDIFSFFLLFRIADPHFKKTKCYACNELVQQGEEGEHCKTTKHKRKFLAAKYVLSFEDDGEFIREVRRNYFHCGFCNKAFPFLEKLREHIVSFQHKTKQAEQTGLCLGSIKFNTESDDLYSKLLHYGFKKD